jgi:hypothetical protein
MRAIQKEQTNLFILLAYNGNFMFVNIKLVLSKLEIKFRKKNKVRDQIWIFMIENLIVNLSIYILFESLFSKSYVQVALPHAFFSHIDLAINDLMM